MFLKLGSCEGSSLSLSAAVLSPDRTRTAAILFCCVYDARGTICWPQTHEQQLTGNLPFSVTLSRSVL
jgi:hypothetical protein